MIVMNDLGGGARVMECQKREIKNCHIWLTEDLCSEAFAEYSLHSRS